MKVLLINQAFYPDVVATSQQLADLAAELASRNHTVTVIAGNRGYDDASQKYPSSGEYKGARIRRIGYASLGKKTKAARAAGFASFHLALGARLLLTQRQDVVVALTSPPLVAWTAGLFCQLKRERLFYWVMDMNPDEALAAGWLTEGSWPARLLGSFSAHAFKRSHRIVALDRFMKERITGQYGIESAKISVIPPWAHDDHVHPVERAQSVFRARHGLAEKFVVMYSGNHSPCHSLETVP